MTLDGKPILPPRAPTKNRPRYGPHDPTTAPDSLVVGRPGRWPNPPWEVRPLHPALVRQRAVVNTLAAADDGLHPCPECGGVDQHLPPCTDDQEEVDPDG